jgi:hypothetical protein|tara:strand:+ start:277 stop:1266 length:990 start_codon:yes stop_codon:yes gene_type:complete
MAIFRAGKRIGPFDIRGGISRGDYKSSAYHKTDKDPRFKMHANTDNTIGRFRAAMASAEGYARPSRYAIRLFPPSNLRKLVEQQNATTTRGGTNFDAEMYNDTLSQVEAYTARGIQNLNQTIGRQVNIHCDTVTMPGRDLLQQEVQYGSDVKRQMVQTHTYEGNISATFYADKYMRERQFFEMWQNLCVDPISHTANYYDSYVGKMHIYQLGSDTEVNRDMPTYAIEALDVYPATIGAVEYGYAKGNEVQKITVEFAYKSWRNMGTETTGIDFGHAMQTAANVKARTPGILDRLPPDLRRAGKDIFQQGRTVWNPIGRIFKGKVFPPFT